MHGKKRLLILFFALIIMFDAAGTALTLKTYRQFSIEPGALLGENGANLKEFALGEDGILTALSDDPWIYYAFGEPVNIRFVTVETSDVGGPDSDAQIYLMPSRGYRFTALTGGKITMRFGRAQGCINVGGLRFDMATVKDASLKVGTVTVNDRTAVILDFQRMFAVFLALCGLAAAELLGWLRLLLDRKDSLPEKSRRKKMTFIALSAVVQAGFKVSLLWILRKPLMNPDGVTHQNLLWWMLVLGLEIFCIMTVHLGADERRRNIWFVYTLTIPFALIQFALAELLNLTSFDFQTPFYLILNLLLFALVPAVLLLVLRRGAVAFFLASLIFFVLSVANHYYGILRDNPLEYFDIANAGTAVHVVSNYTFSPDVEVIAAAFTAAVMWLVLAAALGMSGCGYRIRTVAGNFLMVAALAGFVVIKLPAFGNFSNIQIISRENGYLLSFVSFIKMGQIKKPEGYSPEAAEMILAEADGSGEGTENVLPDGGKLPNIIVIMNETLADMPDIYGFETKEDALPFIHSMTENTIHGKVLVSVYGGGTANTEYEFLTGNSLYFFPPGSSPYVQYTGSHQQSLAWKLQNYGYSSAAYHPYLAISYRRTAAYPLLGLDPFYSIEDDLPGEEYMRSYLSDRADFKNLIYLYEERDAEKPFFIFNVTMQNHGGYSNDEPAVDVTVEPMDGELKTPAFLEYLSLVHASDAAFEELIDYFSGVDEDTIILMFGDHQPSVDESVANALDRSLMERDGRVDPQRRYYATFVMWANFDIEEQDNVITSPGYLRTLLLEQAGVPLNAYEKFLLKLSEEYPAINAFGYRDIQGEWHEREENTEGLLDQYRYLIYNNVFDKKNMAAGNYE